MHENTNATTLEQPDWMQYVAGALDVLPPADLRVLMPDPLIDLVVAFDWNSADDEPMYTRPALELARRVLAKPAHTCATRMAVSHG